MGKGTTFTIYLPAVEKAAEQKETRDETDHKGWGKILVLDDQAPVLKMVGRMLGQMGYETVFAKDGAEAVEIYQEAIRVNEPFDLVILDLTVPGGMGGAKTIPALLKIDPKVKAIVSSGYSNDSIISNYGDYGFCEVAPKPYSKAHLAELLNRVLGKKE